MPDLSDKEIIERALSDSNDFSLIIDKYSPKLERYIKRLSKVSAEDAEDVLQETFIKIYKNLNDYDFNFPFSSWVYRITHNQLMDFFRKKKVRPQILISDESYNFFDFIPEKNKDLLLEAEKKELLDKSLNELKDEYKEVLVLKYLEQKSYNEISDILKRPSGTIATMLNRAKKELRNIWISKIK